MSGCTVKWRTMLAAGVLAIATAAGAQASERAPQFAGGTKIIRGASSHTVRPPKFERNDVVSPGRIMNELARAGYSDIRLVRHNGGVWHITAVRNNGAVYKLRVRQRDGRIISRRRSGWSKVPVPGRHRDF